MKTKIVHSYSSTNLSFNDEYSDDPLDLCNEHRKPSENDLIENQPGICDYVRDWSERTFKMKTVYRKVPMLEWIQVYTLHKFIADLIAGFTVGLTGLPQGLAYARIAGLPAQYGLYAGFVGSFVYIVFGSTTVVSIGPTAGLGIVTLAYTAGHPPELAVLLCFLMGVVTLLLGIFQLGFLVNFISTPVINGFTAAMAITICFTQLRALLGLSFEGDGFVDVITGIFENIGDATPSDTILSAICIVSLLLLYNIQSIVARCFFPNGNMPPALNKFLWYICTGRNSIVVLICTVIFNILGDPPLVGVIGHIQSGIPEFKNPLWFTGNTTGTMIHYTFDYFWNDNKSALLILPLIGLFEHITVAKALNGPGRVDGSQEMITIGLSNIIGAFWSSMPVSGSFSRTTVNHASGVQTQMGNLVSGILSILALLYLTPYFSYLPNATLAAVIVLSVLFMVDFGILLPMWRSKKMDLLPWAVTFIAGLISLASGILLGLLISILYLLYYAAKPGVKVKKGETTSGVEFIIVVLDRSLTFPSVDYTKYALQKSGETFGENCLPVVIDCHHIQFADFTAAQGISKLFVSFNEKRQRLILWRLKPSVLNVLTSVMENSNIPFTHCCSEIDLEGFLENNRNIQNGLEEIKMDLTKTRSEISINPTVD